MDGEPVETSEIAEYLSVSKQTVYNKVKKHENFKIIDGLLQKNN